MLKITFRKCIMKIKKISTLEWGVLMVRSNDGKVISLRWKRMQRKYKHIFEFSSRITSLFLRKKRKPEKSIVENTDSKNICSKPAIR